MDQLSFTPERLDEIFERTDGKCHLCGKGMCRSNYATLGARGAWEVEHSNPRCKGGSDHLNNLYGAHIRCNRFKGQKMTRTARSWHGRTKAPLSAQKKQDVRQRNACGLAALGLALGAMTGGLGPALFWGATGAAVGNSLDPGD
jgi:hypothetical protein